MAPSGARDRPRRRRAVARQTPPQAKPAADAPAPSSAPGSAAAGRCRRPASGRRRRRDGTDAAAAAEPAATDTAQVQPDIDHLRRAWPIVLEAVKKRQAGLAAVLGEGSPESLEGDTLVIKFPAGYGFQANQVARGENPKVITEALREVTGKQLRITTKLAQEAEQTAGRGGGRC